MQLHLGHSKGGWRQLTFARHLCLSSPSGADALTAAAAAKGEEDGRGQDSEPDEGSGSAAPSLQPGSALPLTRSMINPADVDVSSLPSLHLSFFFPKAKLPFLLPLFVHHRRHLKRVLNYLSCLRLIRRQPSRSSLILPLFPPFNLTSPPSSLSAHFLLLLHRCPAIPSALISHRRPAV